MNRCSGHDRSEDGSVQALFADPLADKGVAIQALAARHARLLLHTNIWQRPASWPMTLQKQHVADVSAFACYCRLVRRYGLQVPIPLEDQCPDPVWWQDAPVRVPLGQQETEQQALARFLYLVAVTDELVFSGYISTYILTHVGRWNRRVTQLWQEHHPGHACTEACGSTMIRSL